MWTWCKQNYLNFQPALLTGPLVTGRQGPLIIFFLFLFFQIHTFVLYGLSLMNSILSVFHLAHVKGKKGNTAED